MARKRDIERFVEASIEQMVSSLSYAQDQMAEGNDPEKNAAWWRDWARQSIRRAYDGAFGALVFANVYAGLIDLREYNDMVEVLTDARCAYEDKVWTRLI